jgi:hypothetical protein
VLVQRPALAGAHGDMPVNIRSFWPLDCPKVAGIGKHHSFFTVQQSMALRDIVYIDCCPNDGVHQASVSINTNMRLHTEVPLAAHLGLVHIRIPLTRAVLGRTRLAISVASTTVPVLSIKPLTIKVALIVASN